MAAAARLFKTEAIILRTRKFGEADRVLTVLTPGWGKFDAKAKGVRKTTNRMSGHLQPLSRCMLALAQGHTMEVVTGCETLEGFARLRGDLDLLSRGLYAAELVDRMIPERVPGLAVYRLLLDTLRRLAAAAPAAEERGDAPPPRPGAAADLALRHLEMRLMDESGFRPELYACVSCGRALEPDGNYFAPQSGGVVCRGCVPGLAGPRVLSTNGLKVLRLLQRGPYNEIARLRVGPDLAEEVERHLRSYIVYVLERDVKAAAFLERLRRESAAGSEQPAATSQ